MVILPTGEVYLWPNADITDVILDENGSVFPAGGAYVPLDDYYQNAIDRGYLLTYLAGGSTSGPVIPGAGNASSNAEYVLKSANGTLPNGRVLRADPGITIDYSVPGQVGIGSPYAVIPPLPGGAPVNVTKSAAQSGASAKYARDDHKHDITTGVPVSLGVANDEGTSSALARADHVHQAPAGLALSSTTPLPVAVTGSVGTSGAAARGDHAHAHGAQTDGTMHAIVTTSVPGFMSAADKTKLDGISPGAGSGVALTAVSPQSVGTANTVGTGTAAAREDHVHNHGSQTVGTHHAVVTTSVNGFMAFADKVKLDGLGTSGFLNVLDAGVTAGPLANNTLRTTNAANFTAAIGTAISTGKILLVPPLTYETYGSVTIGTGKDFLCWKGCLGSIIKNFNLATPVLHIGPPVGTAVATAIIASVYIDGVQLRYNGVATSSAASGMEETSSWRCAYRNIAIGDPDSSYAGRTSVPYDGLRWDGTVGTLANFSNVYENFIIKMFLRNGVRLVRDDAGGSGSSTGSVFRNFYISGGANHGSTNQQDISALANGMMEAAGLVEITIEQFNFEWCTTPTAIFFNNVQGATLRGLHIEGVELKNTSTDRGAFVHAYNSSISANGFTLYDCYSKSANAIDTAAMFMVGAGGSVTFDNGQIQSNDHTGTSFYVVRSSGYSGQDGIRVNAGHVNIGGGQITAYEACTLATADGSAIFGQLTDFESDAYFHLADANATLYRYLHCGHYTISPSVARTVTLSPNLRSGFTELNPQSISLTILRDTSAGSLTVVNGGGGGGSYVMAGGAIASAKFTFDGANWQLTEANTAVQLSTTAPLDVGSANAVGTSTTAAHADHVHNHGSHSVGTDHAVVTPTVNGFMVNTDKVKLDAISLSSYVTLTNDPNLAAERALGVVDGIVMTDNGANSSVILGQKRILGATRMCHLDGWCYGGMGSSGTWFYNGVFPQQSSVVDDTSYYIDVSKLLWGVTPVVGISNIQLYVQGGAGHSALPATMPQFELIAVDYSGNISTYFTPQVDASPNVTAYQNVHVIGPWTGGPYLTPTDQRIIIRARGESGANAVAGLKIVSLTVALTFY